MSSWSWANVFDESHHGRLAAVAAVVNADHPNRSDERADELAAVAGADVLVTCWGAPHVSDAVVAEAPSLRLLAHAAGTVKGLLGDAGWARGIVVTSAAGENAKPVAEYTVAAIVMANKRAFLARDVYRTTRRWPPLTDELPVPGNRAKVVGVIGASRVGRLVLDLLRSYELETWVSDPMLDEAGAAALGARLVDLDELMAGADVVSLHAPLLPSTVGLIDARRLSLMKEGGVFVNTARGAIVDGDVLVDEVASGRITAVIDTTDPEPLPEGHPLLDLPGAFVTPHLAGSTGTELTRLADAAVEEVERFADGRPPRSQVTAADLPFIA